MLAASLLNGEALMVDKSAIGRKQGTTVMEVERGKIMEFARAILDDNPVYIEPNPPAPPTLTMAGAHWPQTESGEGFAGLGLEITRVLHAGQEFEYLGEIRVGDMLTARGAISDIYEKEGKRGGTMMFIESETTFTNQRGEDVLKSKIVLVQTAKPAG
jgi:MaoC dehydratase-like protein